MVRFVVIGRRTWRWTLTLAIVLGLGTWAVLGDMTRPPLTPEQVRSAWESARAWVLGLLPDGTLPADDVVVRVSPPAAPAESPAGPTTAVPPVDQEASPTTAVATEEAGISGVRVEDLAVVPATQDGLNLTAGAGYDLFRMDRARVRSERMELLRQVLGDTTAGEGRRADAQQALMHELDQLERELAIENLLHLQGYDGAVAILGPEGVEVVLSRVLDADQASRLGGLVANVAGVGIQQVSLVDGLTSVR